ncbi:hypothetical protein CHISP_0240 [Chitinispirillum alkaliphilum]|nr:hypothetical protein CHISP_0240 [Chitinispirillum alkaliphilum]
MSKIFLTILFTVSVCISNNLDSEHTLLDTLEQRIREDYHLCTGHSTSTPLAVILEWKNSVDSIVHSDSFPEIKMRFLSDTDLNPKDIRPCEVVNWHQREIENTLTTEGKIEAIRKKKETAERDSLTVMEELAALEQSPIDFYDIPGRISRKSFEWLISRIPHSSIENRGLFYRVDSIPIGEGYFRGTFYFDRNGVLNKYELESYHFPADSVNTRVRHKAEILTEHFISKTEQSPSIYRVAFLEIKQCEPSLYRCWEDYSLPVSVKLGVRNHKYFAKTVVRY